MASTTPAELAERCLPIELLVTDIDGVMTDGKIVLDDRGIETKNFHVRDGLAISIWHKAANKRQFSQVARLPPSSCEQPA
jgi:3-deoxy-D-manno-octulosonate 8-phosphate phosphatase (KDO 8-P phosphatase)